MKMQAESPHRYIPQNRQSWIQHIRYNGSSLPTCWLLVVGRLARRFLCSPGRAQTSFRYPEFSPLSPPAFQIRATTLTAKDAFTAFSFFKKTNWLEGLLARPACTTWTWIHPYTWGMKDQLQDPDFHLNSLSLPPPSASVPSLCWKLP